MFPSFYHTESSQLVEVIKKNWAELITIKKKILLDKHFVTSWYKK